MRRLRKILALVAQSTAVLSITALLFSPAHATAPGDVSLMQTLSEWMYPGSNLSGGARVSDGGNPQLLSLKCQAILATPDPIEKVIEFYRKKLETPASADTKGANAKVVSTQDDSQGRPVTLRVIVVTKVDSSTTLVISRAAGEKETHIAWSHWLRLDAKR